MTLPSRYRLRSLLSRGLIFDILLADDLTTGEVVAIKSSRGDGAAAARLAHEARMRMACDSDGLIRLRADGSKAQEPHQVLDYVAHCRFDDLTAPHLPNLARPIALRLLSIASSVHGAGFVHGAINGSHVLITADSEVRLCSLGGMRPLTQATEHVDALAVGTLLARCIPMEATTARASLATSAPREAIERDPLLIAVVGALLEPNPGQRLDPATAFGLLAGG